LAHDALEEQLGLLTERLTQVVVEAGEQPHIRIGGREVAQVKPLLGEVIDQGARTVVRQQAANLPIEDRGRAELSADRGVQQFVVRDTAPEEERKPRSE